MQMGSIIHYVFLDIFQRPQSWRNERCRIHTDGSIADLMEGCFASTVSLMGRVSPMEPRSGGANCT